MFTAPNMHAPCICNRTFHRFLCNQCATGFHHANDLAPKAGGYPGLAPLVLNLEFDPNLLQHQWSDEPVTNYLTSNVCQEIDMLAEGSSTPSSLSDAWGEGCYVASFFLYMRERFTCGTTADPPKAALTVGCFLHALFETPIT